MTEDRPCLQKLPILHLLSTLTLHAVEKDLNGINLPSHSELLFSLQQLSFAEMQYRKSKRHLAGQQHYTTLESRSTFSVLTVAL